MLPVDYEAQVYRSCLGKVIGVYLGRPIEGRTKEWILENVGEITHYVNEQLNIPLIVVDDDITGTFTFIKALADSKQFGQTPADFYGKTWLNYLWENQTILWWGGMSHSTEHTAFLRLKQGYSSPETGSMKLNGKEVAEQIGAQIFIDGFGMVAPGNPELAMKLAEDAARVSHDGEAVIAAKLIAGMISIAFYEKDMDKILEQALALIPADSLIAEIHRNVQEWTLIDNDWYKTYDRIKELYGYEIYGGNCHIVPNHAIMAMCFRYAKGDFFKAMTIINTAGWDTDCNAANVGSVVGLICDFKDFTNPYDFRTPISDRVILPTADGTDSMSDVARCAWKIAQIGRQVMGEKPIQSPKNGVYHNFAMTGSVHGYQPADKNIIDKVFQADGKLVWRFTSSSTMTTPVSIYTNDTARQTYTCCSTPYFYHGMNASFSAHLSADAKAKLRMVVKCGESFYTSPFFEPDEQGNVVGDCMVECDYKTIQQFGFEIITDEETTGELKIDWVDFKGVAQVRTDDAGLTFDNYRSPDGWLSNLDCARGNFSNEPPTPKVGYIGKNSELGVFVTGNRDWKACTLKSKFKVHAADESGILLDYCGMLSHNMLQFSQGKLQIINQYYGKTILAECDFIAEENQFYDVEFSHKDGLLTAKIDGCEVLSVAETSAPCGGAGFFVYRGLVGFTNVDILAETDHRN